MVAPGGLERMPISPVGKASKRARAETSKRARADGFTLIELLVVVAIVSVLALGVGLTSGGMFARAANTPRAVAERFSGAVMQARDRAILGRRVIGLHPLRDGWALVQRDAEGAWAVLERATVPRGMVTRWQIDGRSHMPRVGLPRPDDAPPVMFLPDARSSTFGLTLGDARARLACRSDGWGAVTCG